MTDRPSEPPEQEPDDTGLPDDVVVALRVGAAPTAVADRARTAALAAFDDLGARNEPAPVSSLDEARDRRAVSRRVLATSAAAVVALVLVAAGLLGRFGNDEDSADTATQALDSPPAASANESGAAAEERTTTDAAASSGDFDGTGGDAAAELAPESDGQPAYRNLDEFAATLSAQYGAMAASQPAPASDGDERATTTTPARGCDVIDAAGVDPGAVAALVPATVDGEPVIGVVYDSDTGRRAAVVGSTSCSVLDDRAL